VELLERSSLFTYTDIQPYSVCEVGRGEFGLERREEGCPHTKNFHRKCKQRKKKENISK
jgi:hypothetical protein